jgi:hypothetical protein
VEWRISACLKALYDKKATAMRIQNIFVLAFPLGSVIVQLSAVEPSPFWQDFGENGEACFLPEKFHLINGF